MDAYNVEYASIYIETLRFLQKTALDFECFKNVLQKYSLYCQLERKVRFIVEELFNRPFYYTWYLWLERNTESYPCNGSFHLSSVIVYI